MKNICHILFISFLLTSCATRPVVSDAVGEDEINYVTMTCSRPYKFIQDCSFFSGAKRNITLDGFDIKIAGSEKGDTILVMDGNKISNAFKEAFTLSVKSYSSEASNNSFEAVKRVLLEKRVTIFRVRPIVSANGIEGYVLELDSDGYSFLKDIKSS